MYITIRSYICAATGETEAKGGACANDHIYLLPCQKTLPRLYTTTPILKEIFHGLLEGNFRYPTRYSPELGRVRHLQIRIDRAQSFWICFSPNVLDRGHSKQGLQQVGNRASVCAAN